MREVERNLEGERKRERERDPRLSAVRTVSLAVFHICHPNKNNLPASKHLAPS